MEAKLDRLHYVRVSEMLREIGYIRKTYLNSLDKIENLSEPTRTIKADELYKNALKSYEKAVKKCQKHLNTEDISKVFQEAIKEISIQTFIIATQEAMKPPETPDKVFERRERNKSILAT